MRVDGPDEGDDADSRDAQSHDAQSHDALPRDAQSREGQSRDAQSREGQSRDAQSREGQSREGQSREALSRDARAGDTAQRHDGELAGERDADGDHRRAGDHDEAGRAGAEIRVERALGYRGEVEAVYRAYAIDQGCARVERIERETVTPAMRRIEAEDPERHLAGLEHRLKERYRIEEKVVETVEERGHGVEEAFGMVKDAIRYTFCYSDEGYAAGVNRDCGRMEDAGFERSDLRNSWQHDEYKGINTRWRFPESNQLFEVQFHTEASLAAKEETHDAYKQLRTLPEDDAEVGHLRAYQREVTAKVPVPPGALDISDYP